MGFLRGKGFTPKALKEVFKFVYRGGGGKKMATAKEKNPTYTTAVS